MTLQVERRTFHDRRSTQIKVKGIFLVPSTGSSVFLQETSCRTFGRAKSNFKKESDGGNLLIRPTSTCVSIPCLSPSFFPPPCASHCASTGTSCRNCGKLGMHFKKWFGKHGSFLKGSEALMQSSNSSSIISIPASQPKFIFSYHATKMQSALKQKHIEQNLFLP